MGERLKTLGVLTGGGDVPGLNPALKTLVTRASEKGYRVIGIRRGWGGLLAYDRDDPESWEKTIIPLDRQEVRTVDRTGGTFLHTSRTNPGKVATADVPAFLRGADFDPAAPVHHDFTPTS
ncbi:6-phosphofructokinase [Geomonas terrae]|nr:6-phosphofructokinase [Geomonas terrae]